MDIKDFNIGSALPSEGKQKRSYHRKQKMTIADRPMQFIGNLSRGMTKKEAALRAGYSESTALQPSRIGTDTAIKQLMELDEANKQTLGISLKRIQERVNFIAFNQDKDLSSATKLLIPLAKNHGVNLSSEDGNKVTVPVLNIIVKETKKEGNNNVIDKVSAIEISNKDVQSITLEDMDSEE